MDSRHLWPVRFLSGMLFFMAFHPAFAARGLHYIPDGGSVVCVDGVHRYNRALYGAHSGFRVECSDTPVFGIYLPGMGGNVSISLPPGRCLARYTPGRMDYEQGGVSVEVQVMRSFDCALWRITNNSTLEVSVPVKFGGVSGRKFSRNGDLGVDPPDCFDLKSEYCEGNVVWLSGDDVVVSYGDKERKEVCLSVPACERSVSALNIYEGVVRLDPGESRIMAYFPDGKNPRESLESLVARAEEERRALVSSLVISTPDEWLNPVGGAIAVAADGIWGGNAWLHGAIGWRTPHLGWRGAYCGDALGWHDRALMHFETYAANQITDIPPVYDHPRQDFKQNMARAEKRWGTPMYSNGYICRRPGKKTEMSHYDMNLVYADALLRHFLHTGDTASMRRLFPVLKRHLEWEKRNFDPDGDHLYDAYCCIWASDALYYNGGAVTHSSAYNFFANTLAAKVAKAIGEAPAPFLEEADGIRKAVESELWMPDKGCWAEFRELGGHGRVHSHPALWTIYHAIDSRIGDEFKWYTATRYIDREIPHIPLECDSSLFTLSTTNWKPYSWSINNVAVAEVMHTALAYWLADRPADAYAIMKGVVMDNMYSGASPLNFGQISRYDAARGECYRDFADPIGVWSRALAEGLYGIRPCLVGDDSRVVIRPGFPADWDHASISTSDISYSFMREGMVDTYVIDSHYPSGTELELCVPALGLDRVIVNGKPSEWDASDMAFSRPLVNVKLRGEERYEVKVIRDSGRDAHASGESVTVGPVRFTRMVSGRLGWWQPSDIVDHVPDMSMAKAAETNAFDEIRPDKCVPIDMSAFYNDSVSDIFRNRYESPRPGVTTLQIPVQGIGEWCHPSLTADIDDAGLRRLAEDGGGIVRLLDIPFALPSQGRNVVYTSLWDNYPTHVSVPLDGHASRIYMLMAGSTNHMQWGMENARVTVRYSDGYTVSMPLINPVNWAPVEQDLYIDSHAFSQPYGHVPPMRVHFLTGEVSRSLGESLGLKGPADRYIPSGAGVLLNIPVDSTRCLESLRLETFSQDVVAGILGLTVQRP